MPDVEAPPRRLPTLFLAALAALALLFVALGLVRANRSTLRGDEIFTLTALRGKSPVELLRRGAKPQVSPAPLHYLFGRAAEAVREPLNYLGMSPGGFHRLPSLIFTALLGAAAAVLVALRLPRPAGVIPQVLVLCSLAVYWFQPKVFSFACIDRPYALWNGLWLLSLAWLLCRPDSRIGLAVLLSLLAATATAACFQLLAVGLALLVVARREHRPLKRTLIDGARTLAIPALIGAYYAVLSDPLAFEEREYGEAATGFVKFWLVTNLPAWIATLASGLLLAFRPRLRDFSWPVLTLAALLLLMPLIFTLAHSKGYSSPSRQYIWTTTAIPLALFLLALGWSEVRAWRPAPAFALVLALGLVAGYGIATFVRPQRRNDSREWACLAAGSSLRELLREERPALLLCPADMGAIEVDNVRLLAEWIEVRYGGLPRRGKSVLLRDVDGRLVSEGVGPLPLAEGRWTAIPVGR